ncbi:cyclin-dependent protein kinase inhibitor SMR3-like protein [Tanacetum coccineum]
MISDNNHNQNSPTTTLEQPNNALKHQEQTNQHQENQHNEKISSLTIELSSNINDVNEDDEPTTPTSSDQKIPIITTCPPAPRKSRSVPMNNKRKTPSFTRISVDLMVMINAMCDPVEDIDSSERVKKVKKMDVITGEL